MSLHAVQALLCGSCSSGQEGGLTGPIGDSVLILINRSQDPIAFTLPPLCAQPWTARIDTRTSSGLPGQVVVPAEGPYLVTGRSIVVLTQAPPRPS